MSNFTKNLGRTISLSLNILWTTVKYTFAHREKIDALRTHCRIGKEQKRYDVINLILTSLNRETAYLEIGVRCPEDNFNRIQATQKYSVDPGLEFRSNPVDFACTSDDFFQQLSNGDVLDPSIKFDVIFIDGLHLAAQVDRDIQNALKWIKDDGFIVLHDCNPPTEWHARECYDYRYTPAERFWNGTTWKAFLKYRNDPTIKSCCVDCDFGIGVLSKTAKIGEATVCENEFYDYWAFDKDRSKCLGLITFGEFRQAITSSSSVFESL